MFTRMRYWSLVAPVIGTAVKLCAVVVAIAGWLMINCVALVMEVTVALLATPAPTMARPVTRPEVLVQVTVALWKVVAHPVRLMLVVASPRLPLPSNTSGAGFIIATMDAPPMGCAL